MPEMQKKPKLLVIEDESGWRDEIASILRKHSPCDIIMFSHYDKAMQFVKSDALVSFDAAVIDVKLRKQMYDQGGLAILDVLKKRRRDIPVLMLTAYADEYPGLAAVTDQYNHVWTYHKKVFVHQPDKILDTLLADLPPEIGADTPKRRRFRSSQESMVVTGSESRGPFREILTGSLVIILVLAAVVAFLLIFKRFPEYGAYLNVIFGLLVVALICVLLRIFKPKIVSQAFRLYKELMSSSKDLAAPDDANKSVSKPTEDEIEKLPLIEIEGVDEDDPELV